MYINHFKLEGMLATIQDPQNQLVSVQMLEDILQDQAFSFPPGAVDTVLITMLGVPDVK